MTPIPVQAIYLHVPFCRQVCPFCSFSVRKKQARHEAPYLAALAQELALWQQGGSVDLTALTSLYLGGGTPSALEPEQQERLFAWLHQGLPRWPGEVSLECNPEDVTLEAAQAWRAGGVNRVSLGLQSMQPHLLQLSNRNHDPQQNRFAFAALRQAGFANINVDLLFGLPGQTRAEFRQDLHEMIALQPEHFSLYMMDLLPGAKATRLARWTDWLSRMQEPMAEWYLEAVAALEEAGLMQYEVSNFSRQGRESGQNLSNWRRESYLGLGQSAQGMLGRQRYGNHRQWAQYGKALQQGKLPWAESELLGAEEVQDEELMIGLRLRQGLPLDWFPPERQQDLQSLVEQGWAEQWQDRWRLTPSGLLLADELSVWLAARL